MHSYNKFLYKKTIKTSKDTNKYIYYIKMPKNNIKIGYNKNG